MKVFISILLLVCVQTMGHTQTIYKHHLTDIEGNNIPLEKFTGKKILFFIVPINEVDQRKVTDVADFRQRYKDVQMIGLLSYDHGYADSSKTSIIELYKAMGIILSAPVRFSDEKRSGVINWLTSSQENKRFNVPSPGAYQKFFVSEKGRLTATVSAEVPLQSDIVNRIMKRK